MTVVTHISSLGEDVVLEIFLRLSSLATLVRAALTCRAWRRAVASSPDFRRRFRTLHPAPPLLGIFMGITGGDALYRPPCVPSFVPAAGFCYWDLAGPVRGGDFFLTSLLERSTKSSDPYWQILDCCGGRILLTDISDEDRSLIMLNPLMRRSAHEFRYPDPAYQKENGTKFLDPRFICLDDDPPSSFRVLLLAYGRCTLHPSLFSSVTGEWSALPVVDVPARSRSADGASGEEEASKTIVIHNQFMKMQADGFVYWIYAWCGGEAGDDVWWRKNGDDVDGIYLVSLDTTTMEFSFAELPQWLRTFGLHAGEAEDGAACIVYSDRSNNVGVVKHTRGDDGVDRWVNDRVLRFGVAKHKWGADAVDRWVPDDRVFHVELDAELKRLNLGEPCCNNSLSVLAVRDGYVYFSASETVSAYDLSRRFSWFWSLCLATMKVEKLFERSYDDEAYAYVMPWPPCLLAGNYGQFAFEGAP